MSIAKDQTHFNSNGANNGQNSCLITFWLSQCCFQSGKAYTLLEKYQYRHDCPKYGDLGGINVRIAGKYFEPDEDGDFYIAQAVWYDQPSAHIYVAEPLLLDIIAWHPEKPRQWYFLRGEAGLILGEKAYFEAGVFKEPLVLHSTPFAWLRSGCVGCVLLDHHGLNRLYGLSQVTCEDDNHKARIEKGLSLYYLKNMPRVGVALNGGNHG